ncbi:MAG: hypothetical protein AAFV95_14455 [Bacteroidota bacterium]
MKPLNEQIHKIESMAGDELKYFLSVGPEYYSTAELLELVGMIKAKLKIFSKLHKLVILIGASSPAWVVLGFLCALVGVEQLAFYFTTLFPVSLVVCIAGAFWLKKEFNSKAYLEHVARTLRWELVKRQEAQEEEERWR